MIRVRPHGILPLELWDLLTPDGGILWDHMRAPHFGEMLCDAVSKVWNGTAETRSEGCVSEEVCGFHTLHLAGGGAEAVLEAMRRGPWTWTTISSETTFAAEAGGRALLAERGLDGWVLDVGQSRFKLSGGSLRLQKARDWSRLPLRDDGLGIDIEKQRAELRLCLADFLKEMHKAVEQWPSGLVVALPSRLDDGGVPEGSSYTGMCGDADLVTDVMMMAGMPEVPAFVVNDAELAAASAHHEFDLVKPALVLTLGFGIGGAIVRDS